MKIRVLLAILAIQSADACDQIFAESFETVDILFDSQLYIEREGAHVGLTWERVDEPVYISLWNLSDDCEQAGATQVGGRNLGFGQFHFQGDEGDTFEFRVIPHGDTVRFTY